MSTYMFSMSLALGGVSLASMQMNGNSGDDAVDPFPAAAADLHGLRGIELVENRRQVPACGRRWRRR